MSTSLLSKSLAALGLSAFLMGAAHATVFGPGAGGSIPDGVAGNANNINLATAGLFTSTIDVATSGLISSFDSVTLTGLSHTWVGDLVITLSHGGRTVDLIDHLGATAQNRVGSGGSLNGNYTFRLGAGALPTNVNIAPGTYAPSANPAGGWSNATDLLSSFAGLDVNGPWTLTIRDLMAADTGRFTSWSFDATLRTSQVPLPGSAALMLAGVLAAGLTRRARVS